MKKIIPAILTNDVEDLKTKLVQLKGLVDWVQIDIMDNIFVPNQSIGVAELKSISHAFNLEAHLMVEQPEKYFHDCLEAGFKRVIFHVECCHDLAMVFNEAKNYGFEIGIALNPETPIEHVLPFLDKVKLVLFLTVHPGFQGQEFIPEVMLKIKKLKEMHPEILLAIDGGLKLENIQLAASSGADYLCVGSGVFKNGDPIQNLKQLNEAVS
ncbi:MAG: ribulose-phosphate 3-epimerase [Patescibacteria group bacterium]|jgi:ribulose-phosphate 3-epimerase